MSNSLPIPDGALADYEDGIQVYKISDNGEHFHYVARDAADALQHHLEVMEPDDLTTFTVEHIAGDKEIEVRFYYEGDTLQYRQRGIFMIWSESPEDWRVRSTAASWALQHSFAAPMQISSSII